MAGGFFVGYNQRVEVIADALQTQGVADFYTAPLDKNHPVFSALYDLQKPLPAGEENHIPALTGCYALGRLAGILADGPLWSTSRISQREPALSVRVKLTINLMVYALQQEGFLTWKRQHPAGTGSTDTSPSIQK